MSLLLQKIFENTVDQNPEALALLCGDLSLSYRELDCRANQLAHYLSNRGAGPGRMVGIYFERSERPIIAILACLKAGAAYVPIDPSYPVERIRHILVESEAVLFVTESALADKARLAFGAGLIDVQKDAPQIEMQPRTRIDPDQVGAKSSDLCYVIYTSGTTGRPKGVMAAHQNVVFYIQAFNEVCGTSVSDRVYQGFSLSFDGSIEEIWMAFSNGSSLIVPTAQSPRFGSELGRLLEQLGVTYFSTVPTLLSTISDRVSTLRTLVLSGEVCTPELVNRWSRRGLRLLNVYGPTEATVNTTAVECLPHLSVTIGRPLSGYGLHILDADLNPVAPGEKGELFVSGPSLARGYLKQPKLTAEKFFEISHLIPGEAKTRVYRTGDLVRWNERGQLEFFGRADSQVKLRGFRVELSEVESILLENHHVGSAIVRLIERDGNQELAAYVMIKGASAAQTLDRSEILAHLQSRLPHYMVPGYLDVLAEFPLLTSGKVNRALLPPPMLPLLRESEQIELPKSDLESLIAAAWTKVLGRVRISVTQDFFLDLGGHSLVAAQMVTLLRTETGADVNVRDAYLHPTVRGLAALLETRLADGATDAEPELTSESAHSSKVIAGRTAAFQLLGTYLIYGVASTPFTFGFYLVNRWLTGQADALSMMTGLGAVALLSWPALLVLAVLSKWILIGRYRRGHYPLGGSTFFRWWLAGRFQALSGASGLAGTPLFNVYARLMGARIGRRCTLDTASFSTWDLLSIGDDTSVGADTQVLGYRIEKGELILGSAAIGARCFIGLHSALGLNTQMGDESRLDDQSLLPDGAEIAASRSYRGSPAQPGVVELHEPLTLQQRSFARLFAFGVAHAVLTFTTPLVLMLPTLLLGAFIYAAFIQGGKLMGVLTLFVAVPLSFIVFGLFLVGLRRTVLWGGTQPGVYPVESIAYLRKSYADSLMRLARTLLLPLYTTLYLPTLLRMFGAQIGARAEISTLWYCSPDLVEIGEESFFADGSIIGGKRFFGGRYQVGINQIGRRSFVGNSALLPVGKGLGQCSLLGVQSTPPVGCRLTPDGTDWLGSPAFVLPNRKKIVGFSNEEIFTPSTRLMVQRAIIDGLRIVIPGWIVVSTATVSSVVFSYLLRRWGLSVMMILSPLVAMMGAIVSVLAVIALKWAVMGRFEPVIKPLWSMYVWLNEMVNGAYESVMAPALVPFLGTPFVVPFLRLLGCKIGRNAYIDTMLFSEFDLVEIGDRAALNSGSIIQSHLFEDRVMKSSRLKIGDDCSVANMSVVLYDTEMKAGSTLGPLSLLMKGEALAQGSRTHGIPTSQVRRRVRSIEFHAPVTRGLRTAVSQNLRPLVVKWPH